MHQTLAETPRGKKTHSGKAGPTGRGWPPHLGAGAPGGKEVGSACIRGKTLDVFPHARQVRYDIVNMRPDCISLTPPQCNWAVCWQKTLAQLGHMGHGIVFTGSHVCQGALAADLH